MPNVALISDLERMVCTDNLLNWLELRTRHLAKLAWDEEKRYVRILDRKFLNAVGIKNLRLDIELQGMAAICPSSVDSKLYDIRYHDFRDDPFMEKAIDHKITRRTRFAIAHEIIHTLWFKPGGGGTALSGLQSRLGSDPTIEWLCNRGAASLLLPSGRILMQLENQINTAVGNEPPPFHHLIRYAESFLVPLQMVVRRVLFDRLDKRYVIFSLKASDLKSHKIELEWVSFPWKLSGKSPRLSQREVSLRKEELPQTMPNGTQEIIIQRAWMDYLKYLFRYRTGNKPWIAGISGSQISFNQDKNIQLRGYIASWNEQILVLFDPGQPIFN